jgi:hypothetical protein
MGYIATNYWHWRCYKKNWNVLCHYPNGHLAYALLCELTCVNKLIVGTLSTYSSSACAAAIPFCVYQIWMINILFQQTFCMLNCVYIFCVPLHIYKLKNSASFEYNKNYSR